MAAQTFRRSKIEKTLATLESALFFAERDFEKITDDGLRSYKEGQISMLRYMIREIKQDFGLVE